MMAKKQTRLLIINGKNHECVRVSLIVMGAGINTKQGNIGNGFIVNLCAVDTQLTVRFREIPINFDIPHKIPCGTHNTAAENQHNRYDGNQDFFPPCHFLLSFFSVTVITAVFIVRIAVKIYIILLIGHFLHFLYDKIGV